MTTHERRGWCPSLSAPMATGDGLLARLYPRRGELTPKQLAGLADAAARHGNGGIEITSRGNLQFRGFTTESAALFRQDVFSLDIAPEPTPDVRLPPLAAVPARLSGALIETAEALREAIDAERLGERLAPKFSLLVDSAELAGLAGIAADLRLTLMQARETGEVWQLAVGGTAQSARPLGFADRSGILGAAIALARLAASPGRETRMRTLSSKRIEAALDGRLLERGAAGTVAVDHRVPPPPPSAVPCRGEPVVSPVLRTPRFAGEDPRSGTAAALASPPFTGGPKDGHAKPTGGGVVATPAASIGPREVEGGQIVLTLGLAFGQVEAATLAGFCAALPASALLTVEPARLLLVSGLALAQVENVIEAAERAGMVTRAADPRRFISACAGAPGCASGRLATRELARRIADEMPGLVANHPLYIGGCPKQCARPESPHVALTGDDGSVNVDAGRLPLPAEDRAWLVTIAQEFTRSPAR